MEQRVLSEAERNYTFAQSQQLSMQTGLIGYLRADFGSGGKEFYSTWNEFLESRKTDSFKAEFDMVINSLRESGQLLSGRASLERFCYENPESSYHDDRNHYGVRIDTEHFAYLMRLNPNRGEYNLYCYCYERKWLDRHLQNAEKGIRFIDPNYKTQFILKDGDRIRIIPTNGTPMDRQCRYIDECHLEVGLNLYHICEFAEIMQRNGNEVIPLRSSLPEQCYVYLPTSNEIGIIKKGEQGYYKTDISSAERETMKKIADAGNKNLGVTKAQAEAMKAGSMFSWKAPAADPKNYDENGAPAKPKGKRKEYER